MNVMPIRELIDEVTEVCKANILIVIRRFAEKSSEFRKKPDSRSEGRPFRMG